MYNSIIRATTFVKSVLSNKIKLGNIAVDGTMGNGNDTIFLAELVGSTGKIYSFDIQELAIENTKRKISENKIEVSNVKLIKDGHENMEQHIKEEVDVVMFNLGYLPGGDTRIITKPSSTIKAISQAIDLLKPSGIISLIIYYGHEGGVKEKKEILNFLNNLPKEKVCVVKCDYINHKNNPPIVVFIEKTKNV